MQMPNTVAIFTEKDYPAAPWHLQGQLYGSVWTVPARACRVKLPEPFKPLINFGRVGVFAGYVDYQQGSTLTYHELIAGLVIRLKNDWRMAFHVSHIWVDNATSMRAGRAVWGVPKQIATFDYKYGRGYHDLVATAQSDTGTTLASGSFRSYTTLPVRLPTPFPDFQIVNGQPHSASGTYWSKIGLCAGGMSVLPESPLAELGIAGRKPLLNFAGLDFTMRLEVAKPL